ncbi:MAG: chromate efflux transporter [Vulcanimicrobiaceae bacterium]
MTPWLEVFTRFLWLGLTSFGGPIAHIGYFRRELVERARWLDDAAFGEMLALCSVLPGPTSSQVGLLLGYRRAGPGGALAAWLGFTLPSAMLMTALGIWLGAASPGIAASPNRAYVNGMTEGLLAAAAGVVALAVVQMARTFAATRPSAAIAVGTFAYAIVVDRLAPGLQWIALVAAGGIGARWLPAKPLPVGATALAIPRRAAYAAAAIFALLLLGLPIVAQPGSAFELFALCFRAGSLVFGGGHVVLPFLQSAIGPLVSERTFFAGYGAVQAMPGPLSTFAAFLGATARVQPAGIPGAAIGLAGIFLPSFLLLVVAVPLWRALRDLPRAASVLAGLSAAVVGLLGAVLVDPIATSLARDPLGLLLALGSFALLAATRVPAWAVVIVAAAIGTALQLVHR